MSYDNIQNRLDLCSPFNKGLFSSYDILSNNFTQIHVPHQNDFSKAMVRIGCAKGISAIREGNKLNIGIRFQIWVADVAWTDSSLRTYVHEPLFRQID